MKRNYISPAIETAEILVEAGIAMSEVQFAGDNFGLGTDTNYEDGDFAW